MPQGGALRLFLRPLLRLLFGFPRALLVRTPAFKMPVQVKYAAGYSAVSSAARSRATESDRPRTPSGPYDPSRKSLFAPSGPKYW